MQQGPLEGQNLKIKTPDSRSQGASQAAGAAPTLRYGPAGDSAPANDPEKRDRLMKGLDVFLERDRDRELFDLPNKALTG